MAARLEFSIVLSEIHLIYCTNYGKFLKGRATRLRKACGQCGQVMQALQQQKLQQQQQQQQIYFTLVADAFYKFGTLDHKKWFEPWQKSVKLQMASPWIDKLLILLRSPPPLLLLVLLLLLPSSLPSLVLALFGIASISIVVVAAATYKTHVVFQR